MKQFTIMVMAAFLISGLTVYSQTVKPGAVAGFAKVKPATGDITNDQFETYYLEEFFPVFNKEFPSIPISLLRKIKGKRMGEYAEFYVFESMNERNRWFPKPGVSSEEAKTGFKNLGEDWDKYHQKMVSLAHTDYVVLPFSSKSIHVKPGNIVAIFECEITLEEGMTFEDLEQLYQNEYGPAFMKNFQGSQFCVLKGERGERTGKYTEMVVLKSMEEYNKFIRVDGQLTETARQAFQNMGEIQVRMEKMYTYQNSDYYVVLDNKAPAQLDEQKTELQKLQANKAIAERFHHDLSLERKWEVAEEFLAPGIVLHLPGTGDMVGIDAVKSFDEMYASMKNAKINHYEIIAEGDYVFIRWDMSFDNTVDLMGIPATGNRIGDIGGMDLFLIENGKIKEFWQFYDEMGFMKQLGVIPSE